MFVSPYWVCCYFIAVIFFFKFLYLLLVLPCYMPLLLVRTLLRKLNLSLYNIIISNKCSFKICREISLKTIILKTWKLWYTFASISYINQRDNFKPGFYKEILIFSFIKVNNSSCLPTQILEFHITSRAQII